MNGPQIAGQELRLGNLVEDSPVLLGRHRDVPHVHGVLLPADVEGLVRVVNQLTLENRQLRERLSAHSSVVRVLPVQYTPPGPD
ncbi:hypothetical protein [Streptomyces sp. bgisy034]|uniref:hypothetical protein n=1 Tax=Streptomyces sp. bgisy034 TaxID=3413774 RepID=UPI003EBA2EF0